MPTYLYGCDTCGVRFERFHSVNHVMDKNCPNRYKITGKLCMGQVSRKVNSNGVFLLKGEGWSSSEARDKYHETSNDKHRYVGGKPWE